MTHPELLPELTRRREASRRLQVLTCGCQDPWTCHCRDATELTDQYVDGWRDAAVHLLDAGVLPSLPVDIQRALWRRGGHDRALIEHVRDLIQRAENARKLVRP
ncbi:hypothetical protein [Rhodococcus pyridinivorans]|uniref:Uncharacterized protein n=1 Tax=Rhodococcus pyridinivorans AK37 TaxID=1114960 RepID=H0JQ35_9NOCA|nr:hypothetical protein [Rhodococcus pyridinivorans]EHK84254.1 hypothetical protein AK37_08052 [Rhodococcus pyridinivorans AK37]MCD2142106.1 hypothetical protein [Rhodococcus pyridinivorans]